MDDDAHPSPPDRIPTSRGKAADDRDDAADEREDVADERDRVADLRDDLAAEREGELRAQLAPIHTAALERDLVAEGRDAASREREVEFTRRAEHSEVSAAEVADHRADRLDRVASGRDRDEAAADRHDLDALGRAGVGSGVREAAEVVRSDADDARADAEVDRRSRRRREALAAAALSEREVEVLVLLASAKPYAEIASELYISVNSVKTHCRHLFRKLGVGNRTAATLWALENHVVE